MQQTIFNTTELYSKVFPKTGLPFQSPLDINIAVWKIKRFRHRKPTIIVIDGAPSTGKTTLGIEILEAFQQKPIDYKTQYAMGGAQFQEKLNECQKAKEMIMIYDEAGDFNKRGGMTKFNQELNRVFETFRAFNIIIIVILPNCASLDTELMKKFVVRGLINCQDRDITGRYRAYSTKRLFYILHYAKKTVVPSYPYSQVSPNFRGRFYDLAASRSNDLNKISLEGKKEILDTQALRSKGLRTVEEIGKELGMAVNTVRKYIQVNKLKPELRHKQKKFYSGDTVIMIKDLRNDALQDKREKLKARRYEKQEDGTIILN